MVVSAAVYRPRNPQATDYYHCVEDHLEAFIQGYEERFERTYGFFRPYLPQIIYRYLDCGDLYNGFARLKCKDFMSSAEIAFSLKNKEAMESLARYIIRASFSQEWMQYLADEGTVIYSAKDGKTTKSFPAMEWLAAMCSHIPNRGEQMVRYYGYYSNVSRGKRQKEGRDDVIPCILEPQGNEKAFRKSWTRLIQKIYEVDPLVCPKCQGAMRIISFIEDQSVIRDILNHLGLWLARARPPPKAHAPPIREYAACDLQLQKHADTIYGDPEYSWDAYIHA